MLNSYWAGFVAADGCITSNDRRLLIGISTRDKHHLEKFQKDVEYDGKIKDYQQTIYNGTKVHVSKLQIFSHKIADDLEKNFGITPRKTHNLKLPKLSNENLFAFVLGCFDGDGSFTTVKGRLDKFSLVGTENLVVKIKEFFVTVFNFDERSIYVGAKIGCWRLEITKLELLQKLRTIVEEGYLHLPLMERKWSKLLNSDIVNYKTKYNLTQGCKIYNEQN